MENLNKPALDERKAYETMKNRKEKFGVFHKSCFHVHTPASHDYKLLESWNSEDFKVATEQHLYEICIEKEIFTKITSLDDIVLDKERQCYMNKKEFLAFILLANEIILNQIEIVLVTDHHTIEGFDKLEIAISELFKIRKKAVYPEVILGIEISCADKNHVVGIFEDTEENREKINKWIKENVLSPKDGSFRTTIDALNFIKTINGIGYIAHLDISDTFKESYLNGAYKKMLFSNERSQFIGLVNYEKRNSIAKKIKPFSSTEIKFIIDNDSHDIDSIADNFFWIKGSKRNFRMVKEALDDYDISISFKEERIAKQYIKGIYIENESSGFLRGDEGAFCLTFSPALNCLIGGRGTGKSSILEILEYVLGQRCRDEKKLDFICSHGNTWILYEDNGEEYLIEMRMPIKEFHEDNVLKNFGQNRSDRYEFNYNYDKEEVKEYSRLRLMGISKIVYIENEWYLEKTPHNKKVF